MTSTADRRRQQTIELVVIGHDVPTIAERLKLSDRHVRRILAEPGVKSQIHDHESERMRAVARKAAALGSGAVVTLAEISRDKAQPAAARVSAARALLDVMLKVGELADLSERVASLEGQLTKGDESWRPRAVS